MVVTFALLASGCSIVGDDSKHDADLVTEKVVEVGPDGAEARLRGVEIDVPSGAAPVGSRLTIKLTEPARSAEVPGVTAIADVVDLKLSSGQPSKPIVVRFDVPATATADFVALTMPTGAPTRALEARRIDADTFEVSTDHLSLFGGFGFDTEAFLRDVVRTVRDALEGRTKRPSCAGNSYTDDDATTWTLPKAYTEVDGDGVVWPCLGDAAADVGLTLTPNSGSAWRVRSGVVPDDVIPSFGTNAGSVVTAALWRALVTDRPYSDQLLVPAGQLVYGYDSSDLPTELGLRQDAPTTVTVHLISTLFNVVGAVPLGPSQAKLAALARSNGLIACISSLLDTASFDALSTDAWAGLIKSVIDCAGEAAQLLGEAAVATTAGFVGLFLGAAGSVWSLLVSAYRELTGTSGVLLEIARRSAATALPADIAREFVGRATQGQDFDDLLVGDPESYATSEIKAVAPLVRKTGGAGWSLRSLEDSARDTDKLGPGCVAVGINDVACTVLYLSPEQHGPVVTFEVTLFKRDGEWGVAGVGSPDLDLSEVLQSFAGPKCPVDDVIAAYEQRDQDCLEPGVFGHLFYPGAPLGMVYASRYMPQVAYVQLKLRDLGYGIAIDGKYGDQTAGAVRRYQESERLRQDGFVGLATWYLLFGLGLS